MTDSTTPQDGKAMSPASDGSVASDIVGRLVAWRDERGFPTAGEMMDEAIAEISRLRLTHAERDDLRVWLAECLRQASIATEGANEELAERWQARATRAAAMIERLGGVR